jgi:hypothetical protein
VSNRSLHRFQKDAVIGLAILVVLLLFWRLMKRPEQLGPYGSWFKTNLFGPLGAHLGESLSPGPGGGPDRGGTAPGKQAGELAATNALDGSAAAANTGGVPGTGANGSAVDETPPTNQSFKVIAALPDDESAAPLTNSPNAAALAQRLGEANAKGGDIQFSLFWGNRNDLDLHCVDPRGIEICYNHRTSEATGGELDVDRNVNAPFTDKPVENIYWPEGGAPPGVYKVMVVHYNLHGDPDPTGFTVRTVVKGKTNFFHHTISYTGQREPHWICSIQYDPSNPDPALRRRFVSFR